MKNKGFTLTELLVVVAIIAVLVIVSIPVFASQIERSCESTDISNMKTAKDLAIAQYESGFDLDGNIINKEGFSCNFDSSSGILSKEIPMGYGRGTETDAGCDDFMMVINPTEKIPQITYTSKTNVENKYIVVYMNSDGTIKTFWSGDESDDSKETKETEDEYIPPEDALPYIMTYDNRYMVNYTNSTYNSDPVFEYDNKKYYIKGYGDDAFKNYGGIITIPESLSYISDKAFYNTQKLSGFKVVNNKNFTTLNDDKILADKNITIIYRAAYKQGNYVIPSTVTRLWDGAFKGCAMNLRRITIPSSVTQIGEGAFFGCNYLLSITIPGSVKTIKANTIYNSTSNTEVIFEEGVENIEKQAVQGRIIRMNIPSTIKNISADSFKIQKVSSVALTIKYNGSVYNTVNDLISAIN